MSRTLVVDDEPEVARGLEMLLNLEGIAAECCGSGEAALERLRHTPFDVVITDYQMMGISGMDLLRQIKSSWPRTRVVVISAYGTIPLAVQAMSLGAHRFLSKPFEAAELLALVREALEEVTLARELEELRHNLSQDAGYGELISRDRRMLAILAMADRIAPHAAPILIEGESGTGKELLARRIHQHSAQAGGPFQIGRVTPGPDAALETAVFAPESGALDSARGGTVLLEDVENLPHPLQARLLQWLERGSFLPADSGPNRAPEARLICTTIRSPEEMVREGKLREDLYYRVSIGHLKLPPLRERPEDIPLLVEHLGKRCAEIYRTPPRTVSAGAHRLLAAYPWPGNVRELWNVIQKAHLLGTEPEIDASDIVLTGSPLPAQIALPFYFSLPYEKARDQVIAGFQREYLSRLIQECGGNLSEVARRSSLTRAAVYKIIRKLGLAVP